MRVVILGAGPAGLATAYDLGRRGETAVVLERAERVGGMCRTYSHHGYLFDVGGHRFFTKYDEVQDLWEEVLGDQLMVRPRLSRIFYDGKLYDYPLQASNALRNLGLLESARCMGSFARARLRPRGAEATFEEWVSNRFGDRLFDIFFRTYTEKVWGIPTSEIGADWAAQRIKNMELSTAVLQAIRRPLERILRRDAGPTDDGNVVASLIEQFHYPRQGPGQMYDAMGGRIQEMGGDIRTQHEVLEVLHKNQRVWAVKVRDPDGQVRQVRGQHFCSSIPLTELIERMRPHPPDAVLAAARALTFRNLVVVNLILDQADLFPDNWVYVHANSLDLGRIQNYKNWSPWMVPDPSTTSLGLEYFCSSHEPMWTMPDAQLLNKAAAELDQTGLKGTARVTDGMVLRIPRAYPVYIRGYEEHLKVIIEYVQQFDNLHPMGRYGMFKYNNSDHSIMTALLTVENIMGATHDVWNVNTETAYHEIRGSLRD